MKNQIQDINSNTLYISKVQKLLPQITTAMTVLSFATIIKPQLDSNLNFHSEKTYFKLYPINIRSNLLIKNTLIKPLGYSNITIRGFEYPLA